MIVINGKQTEAEHTFVQMLLRESLTWNPSRSSCCTSPFPSQRLLRSAAAVKCSGSYLVLNKQPRMLHYDWADWAWLSFTRVWFLPHRDIYSPLPLPTAQESWNGGSPPAVRQLSIDFTNSTNLLFICISKRGNVKCALALYTSDNVGVLLYQ